MKRHPIIVLEGLDGVGKTTLSHRLAAALGATRLASPAEMSITGLGEARAHFDRRDEVVRRAYYRFANLVVSERALLLAATQPVVIDRYWPSTVAFAVGLDDASELAAWVGRYPPELVTPDVVLLLEIDEAGRLARMAHRGEASTPEESALALERDRRARVSRAYRGFAPVVIDTSPLDADAVLERALAELR